MLHGDLDTKKKKKLF